MKYLISFLLLGLCIGCGRINAQGFADFPVSPKDSIGRQTKALPSPKQMFDRYLQDRFPFESPHPKSAFILVPENGCGYCKGKVIAFHAAENHPNLHLIIATSSPVNPTGSHFFDVGEQCKRYGFGNGFPVVALLEGKSTKTLLYIDSQEVDVQLEEVRNFLGASLSLESR